MTGAVMPAGADTVVVQEVCRVSGENGGSLVAIPAGQKAGQNVRFAGEDLKAGVAVLAPGQPLRAAEIGLIASLGIGEVSVRRRLRVAFFSTGDELASIGKPLAPGEVYDSNRYTLHGLLAGLGVEILDLGVCATTRHSWKRPSARRPRAPTPSSPPAASRWARRISSSS